MKVSVVILTLNESMNIVDCIESAKLISDDIVVLDSYSADNTKFLAKNLGARVVDNKFIGYASQRNFALKNIKYQYPWVFMLDADERANVYIANEISSILNEQNSNAMYKCRRKDYFLGKWIRRSSGYPTWFPRLFKLGCCQVTREINEEYSTSGSVGYLDGEIDHYPFNKGVSEWFDKHNRYSSMEAELIYNKKNKFILKELFSSDPSIRRRSQKSLVYSLPFRPLLVFFIFYFIKLGFLDGKAGFQYCVMKFVYELMISTKVNEFKSN